nr:MAG TPA: hypothetical protein [Caudoviricetes sp.]
MPFNLHNQKATTKVAASRNKKTTNGTSVKSQMII